MSRNAIISLAMLYALWQTKRGDLLDLIRPFILYAVGMNTKVGEAIDTNKICRYMESEFGYRSFEPAVAERVISRETSMSIPQSKRVIEKRNRQYILIASLSPQIDKFTAKRTACKEHSDAVTSALAAYLNQKQACRRSDYSQVNAEILLLSFFERQGGSIILSVEDLRQLTIKSNEIDYFIGKFILEQSERKSLLMDYLVELVKGYFVTTALYLQAENTDITRASFSNVTFYLDTRLLLAYLGFKTPQENSSVQEMIRSLRNNGAKLACFSYNIDEVNSILEAYKQSTITQSKHPSTITLEYFDEHGSSYTHVDAAQKAFERRLTEGHIFSISPAQALSDNGIAEQVAGLLNDAEFRTILLKAKPSYNLSTFSDDFTAINTISRIRNGKRMPCIEKCRAVFVTTNSLLVSATKQLLKDNSHDVGFPIAITGNDLCVMAWLKDFEKNNNLPQMRLLENVLAAITPSQELMEAYFSNLENLEQQGKISSDEAALLRVDQFAKKELMELTKGEKDNLSVSVIDTIREKMWKESEAKGIKIGEDRAAKWLNNKRNQACERAEKEIEEEYYNKEVRDVRIVKCVAACVAVVFIVASIVSLVAQWSSSIRWALFLIMIVTTIQGVCPLFSKNNWLIRRVRQAVQRKKLSALDERKKRYLSILDENETVPHERD